MCWGIKPSAGKYVRVLCKFVCLKGGTVKNDAALIGGNDELRLNRPDRVSRATDEASCWAERKGRHFQRLNGGKMGPTFSTLKDQESLTLNAIIRHSDSKLRTRLFYT